MTPKTFFKMKINWFAFKIQFNFKCGKHLLEKTETRIEINNKSYIYI